MSKHNTTIETILQVVEESVDRGIAHLYTEDQELRGNKITIGGKQLINFGSCSYMGLEFDERLIEGSIQMIRRYGTQFSESRAYVSIGPYKEYEALLSKIFGGHAIVAPSTSAGHTSAFQVLIGDKDAVIIDHLVHNSVQVALAQVKARGVAVIMIKHNRLDKLEENIKKLRDKHDKIWYMADGIYSMYGDTCPVDKIYALMQKYPPLHFYVDDAHGMSCFGKNGRGYVLSGRDLHPKMVMATSLNKSFASGGGALVFPNPEWAHKVRSCGSTFVTSGPLQPALIGAGIASAKIHLSDEINTMQVELWERVDFAHNLIIKHNLPLIADTPAPVFFIGAGLPRLGFNIVERMFKEGFYLNLGIFPAVPTKNTGIRFTITRLHSFDQIENMIKTLAKHFPLALKEEGLTMNDIYKAFGKPLLNLTPNGISEILSPFTLHHYQSIKEVNKEEWNNLLGEIGSFDYDGLIFLESSFTCNPSKEENWDFDYLIIRDPSGIPVLATFFTTTLWKDDMLSPAEVSALIEEKRDADPKYLCSRTLSMGSLFTEGQHLYIDKRSSHWKEAMLLLFPTLSSIQEKRRAENIVLRDFHGTDPEMHDLFIGNGYFKVSMPDSHSIEGIGESTPEQFIAKLSSKNRKHLRQDILKHENKYEVQKVESATKAEIDNWIQLYQNVKSRSLELNTFPLPRQVFENMAVNKNWEIFTLSLKPEFDKRSQRKPVAVMFTYKTWNASNFMLIGIDYNFQEQFSVYRQALYQIIKHCQENKINTLNLGFAASFEKTKLGARKIPTIAYMQANDNFNLELISSMGIKNN